MSCRGPSLRRFHVFGRGGSLSAHKGCRPGTCSRDPMPWPSEGLATQGWGLCGWRRCHCGKTSPRADANGSRRRAPGRQLCLWSVREIAAGTVERKSVVLGEGGAVRVDSGGGRYNKQKK